VEHRPSSQQIEKTRLQPCLFGQTKGFDMSTQLYNNGASSVLEHTKNYSNFKFDKTNRPIDEEHVEQLFDAINENNLLHLFPIIVSTDGYIRDGQHRIKAAEALDVPVYYIVSNDMRIEDVPRVTARVSKWTAEEYLHHYVARNSPEYVKLRDFVDEYPFLSVTRAIKLCGHSQGKNLMDTFRDGTFQANDMRFARKVARALLDFKEAGINFYDQGRFVDAIANLIANAEYDHERMKAKLEYLSYKVVKCPDIPTYIQMLNEIYNYKVRNTTRLEMLDHYHPNYRVDLKELRLTA
jgi:hypothetical protein